MILPRFDQANSTTLYRKSGGELVSSLERNIYGVTVSPVIDSVKDTYVFHPTTADDHLAIPFLPLQPSTPTQGRFLQVTLDMPEKTGDYEYPQVILQDEQCNSLSADLLYDASINGSVTILKIPDSATKVRITMTSGKLRPALLPEEISLIQLQPAGITV